MHPANVNILEFGTWHTWQVVFVKQSAIHNQHIHFKYLIICAIIIFTQFFLQTLFT